MKHILLYGGRRSGRSAMIRALLKGSDAPIYGYETRTLCTNEHGYHEIYLFPYGAAATDPGEHCHVGDCNTKQRVIFPEVFNTAGVSRLSFDRPGILVMDEIGFMESEASIFCDRVIECLNGEEPVIAAVRTGISTPFLERVRACENAYHIDMQPQNFQMIYRELLPVVRSWEALLRKEETP